MHHAKGMAVQSNPQPTVTMKSIHYIPVLTIALLLGTSNLLAQERPAAAPAPKAVRAGAPNENASDNAKAVHALLDQFKAQREEYTASRRMLIERLKTCTEEEKSAIIEQLRLEQRERVEEQRALGKQIRDELKTLREQRKTGGE